MPGCGAVQCKNRSEKGFKLYALPTGNRNKERRQLWAKYIGRDPLPEKTFVCEVHFTEDQFELNRADGKKKLKWNAVPRVFAEKKECTKENTPLVENNRNPRPPDITKNSSSLLQENRCGIFEEVNFVVDSPNLKEEILITSDEEELENTKCASQDYRSSHNKIYGANSEEQYPRPFDLSEVCRICFGKTQLENIFIATYQDYTLHNLLELCSSIKINKNTKFKQICVSCKSQLIEHYTFIRKVVTSNNSLQLVELNNKTSSRSENEIEEIFIFVDKHNRSTETYSEITQQDLGNSLVKFETNVNNKQVSDTVKTCQKYASEISKIEKIKEEALKKTNSFENEHIFEVNDENNISQYYLVKADESTIEDFTHNENVFRVPKKEITKILPNLINLTETTELTKTNTNLDLERSEVDAAIPVQSIVHLQDHTYVDKYDEKLNPPSEDKISFLCEKCGLSLSSTSNLRTHIKRVHDGIKSLYSKCQKCNIVFRSQASYETHRSQHVGKYHCCETCGKMFAGMAHLRQHLRRHSTLRPYACGVCNKSFRAKYLLKYHLARHLKEKKYRCPICNEPFLKMSDLRSHINKTHPGKIKPKFFTCNKCDYKCVKKRALQIHLKKIHNLVVKDSPKVIVIT